MWHFPSRRMQGDLSLPLDDVLPMVSASLEHGRPYTQARASPPHQVLPPRGYEGRLCILTLS
jgi:hypothetical protein